MEWLFILATEAVAFDPSSIMPGLSTLGSLGFAVWYAYYTTTVAIPKLMESHRQERLEILNSNRQEREEQQNRHDVAQTALLAELREARKQFGDWMNAHGFGRDSSKGARP